MLLIAYVTANKLVGHYIEVPIKFSALIIRSKTLMQADFHINLLCLPAQKKPYAEIHWLPSPGRKSFGPISDKNISKIQKTAGILAVRLIW